MTLIAPPHLRGSMDAETSRILTEERGRWIVQASANGHRRAEISDALGITPERVSAILHSRRGKVRRGEPKADAMLRKCGLSVGNIRQAVTAMPAREQARLANLAASRGMSAADALCAFFKENRQ